MLKIHQHVCAEIHFTILTLSIPPFFLCRDVLWFRFVLHCMAGHPSRCRVRGGHGGDEGAKVGMSEVHGEDE